MSSSHTAKRQFQPSIDSYFGRSNSSDGVSQRERTTLSPPLPPETQSSLLSVGMRVRKSVPEGYKTHKTMGLQSHTIPPSTAPARSRTQTTRTEARVSSRELLPFCGLHKTGGLAAQQMPPSSAPAIMQDDDSDVELPDLTRSQSTLPSSDAFSTSPLADLSKKRTYEEDMEDDLDAWFHDDTAMDSDALTRGERPKARLRQQASRKPRASGGVRVLDADDFDEAAFLVPDGMEVDED